MKFLKSHYMLFLVFIAGCIHLLLNSRTLSESLVVILILVLLASLAAKFDDDSKK